MAATQCVNAGMALWVCAALCHCHLGVIHCYRTDVALVFCGGWCWGGREPCASQLAAIDDLVLSWASVSSSGRRGSDEAISRFAASGWFSQAPEVTGF